MARTVRNPKIDSRSARSKLAVRREPYWAAIAPGRHLGYRRLGPEGGTWLAKQRDPETGARRHKALGAADDVLDEGKGILTYAAAQEEARAFFASPWRRSGDSEPDEDVVDVGPYTVKRAIDDYITWLETNRKAPGSARDKADAHILAALGDVEVAKLTTKRLRAWLKTVAESPARLRTAKGKAQKFKAAATEEDEKRARRATANRVWTVLRAALNMAWREQKVPSRAAWERVKPLPDADANAERYLSADESRRLLNACAEDFRNIVRAALLTGARYSELCRLRVDDFNADSTSLRVRVSKSKWRWIPLDADGAAFLTSMTRGRPRDGRIFLKSTGQPWNTAHQIRPIGDASAAAKLDPPANFHCLRHTWASHRVMAGVPLLVVAQVLGHADTRMVEKHYGHLAPSYVRDMIRNTPLGIGSGVEGEKVVSITKAA